MKLIFNTLLLLLLTTALAAQTSPCAKVHTGNFETRGNGSGVTEIRRTKNKQYEHNLKLDDKVVLKVRWIDDCTYQLYGAKHASGPMEGVFKKNDVITVHILEVMDDRYKVHITSNFSDLEYDTYIYIK